MRITIIILSILGLNILLAACQESSAVNKPFHQQISEDFDYALTIIKEDYPLLEAQKQATGYDFLADYDKHKAHVMQAKTPTEFFFLMNDVLAKLDNGHTSMMTKADVNYGIAIYSSAKRDDFRWEIYTQLTRNRALKEAYATEIGMSTEQEEQARKERIAQINAQNDSTATVRNELFFDITPKLAYLKIGEMTHRSQLYHDDKQAVIDYLKQVQHYPALVIDIRGNEGGDTHYWTQFLLPQIIQNSIGVDLYSFYKNGKYSQFYKDHRQDVVPIDVKQVAQQVPLSAKVQNILQNFSYQSVQQLRITPAKDSIAYKGNIYLLVDKHTYSAADTLSLVAKASQLATLVGEPTGGDGVGTDPMIAVLPNTNYAMRFTKQLGLDPEGNMNAFYPTTPHYHIHISHADTNNAPPTPATLLSDPVIQKVMALEKL